MPDALRDALLGLALTGSVAISLIANSDGGFWLFVAALTLLGALARRTAARQTTMRHQRK